MSVLLGGVNMERIKVGLGKRNERLEKLREVEGWTRKESLNSGGAKTTEWEGWGLGLVGFREERKRYPRNWAHYNQGVGRKLSQQGLRASTGPVFWAYKEPASVSEQQVFLKGPPASYFPVYTSTQDLTTLWIGCKIHITPYRREKAHHQDGYYLVYAVLMWQAQGWCLWHPSSP